MHFLSTQYLYDIFQNVKAYLLKKKKKSNTDPTSNRDFTKMSVSNSLSLINVVLRCVYIPDREWEVSFTNKGLKARISNELQ